MYINYSYLNSPIFKLQWIVDLKLEERKESLGKGENEEESNKKLNPWRRLIITFVPMPPAWRR